MANCSWARAGEAKLRTRENHKMTYIDFLRGEAKPDTKMIVAPWRQKAKPASAIFTSLNI